MHPPLNGIDKVEYAVSSANLTKGFEVDPVATQILYETDRQQPSAPAGLLHPLQRVKDGQPLQTDPSRLQLAPNVLVSRKLLVKNNNLIPPPSTGTQVQPWQCLPMYS